MFKSRGVCTRSEGDADVLWGHLCAAGGGVDLHFDLRRLHELWFAASSEQIHRQVAAVARVRPIQKVLKVTQGQGQVDFF